MAPLHLVKTLFCVAVKYCICIAVTTTDWMLYYTFGRIFECRWRENVLQCVQFHCQTLPTSYMIDQRKILFRKKAFHMVIIHTERTFAMIT